jgi:hypothetical protein
MECHWSLGAAAGYKTTGNAWASGNYDSASGTVDWISTAGATFFLAGVQIEPGTVATPFERRPYGAELALCQRYYETSSVKVFSGGSSAIATAMTFKVTKRAAPTMAYATAGNRGVTPTSTEWAEQESFGVLRTGGSEVACTFTATDEL